MDNNRNPDAVLKTCEACRIYNEKLDIIKIIILMIGLSFFFMILIPASVIYPGPRPRRCSTTKNPHRLTTKNHHRLTTRNPHKLTTKNPHKLTTKNPKR